MPNSRNASYLNSATTSYAQRRSASRSGRAPQPMFSKRRPGVGGMRRVSSGFTSVLSSIDWRRVLPFAALVAAVLVLFLLVSTLVRSCTRASAPSDTTQVSLTRTLAQASATEPEKTSASAKIGSLNVRANTFLNYDALISKIAKETKSATEREGVDSQFVYTGLKLSLHSVQAANFVAGMSESSHPTVSFSGSATTGICPALYQWDERWGYSEYCGSPLAFSGCGVTVMAMARMGLTGQTDMGPVEMANLSVSLGEASAGTNSTFFYNSATAAATGVVGVYDGQPSASSIISNVQAGSYVAINVKPNTLAGGGHWILVVGAKEDGTLEIRDPNSSEHTASAWNADEIVGYATAMVILSKA